MADQGFKLQFDGVLDKFDGNLWGLHVKIPPIHSDIIISSGNKRLICILNEQLTIRGALMASNEGSFILINQEVAKKLSIREGDSLQVTLSPDTSEYGMDMPEELEVMLVQDEEANEYFNVLTPGKQRNLIYIVNKVKNTDSRIKKALAICHHLKEVQGKLDFKKLNETIKWYNNNF